MVFYEAVILHHSLCVAGFHSEEKEDAAILNAMKKARRTRLLTADEKSAFLRKLKTGK